MVELVFREHSSPLPRTQIGKAFLFSLVLAVENIQAENVGVQCSAGTLGIQTYHSRNRALFQANYLETEWIHCHLSHWNHPRKSQETKLQLHHFN